MTFGFCQSIRVKNRHALPTVQIRNRGNFLRLSPVTLSKFHSLSLNLGKDLPYNLIDSMFISLDLTWLRSLVRKLRT